MKLHDYSAMIFDIKCFNVETEELTDFGFAIQPLIHKLKDRAYLIGGKYQMPVFRGSLPAEFLKAMKFPIQEDVKPRILLKKLYDTGKITQIDKLQIVSEVFDLNPPEDAPEIISHNDKPSMLHLVHKKDL